MHLVPQLSSVSVLLEELSGGVELMEGQVQALRALLDSRQQQQQGDKQQQDKYQDDIGEPAAGTAATGSDSPAAVAAETLLRSRADGLFLERCAGFLVGARPAVAGLQRRYAGLTEGLRRLAEFFQVGAGGMRQAGGVRGFEGGAL